MIEGLILLVELSLLLLLLIKVWRVQSKKEDGSTGFFAFHVDKQSLQSKSKQAKPIGEPPNA